MPKDFFTVAKTTSLNSLSIGCRVHVIGVCGVAMAQIAAALSARGFVVSGSDKEFYEPMKSLLANSAVETFDGYQGSNVPVDADLVVIGNSISYGNPEVEAVEQKNLPFTCFPKILQELAIAGKHSIVVTGTHGKSTTTALIATLLLQDRREPSYFVGGVVQGLPQSLAIGTGNYSVVEGDEYDSAFFAKVPKFSFYTPDTVIINAIEYDHADIYADVQAIEAEFTKLVINLKKTGTVVCCIDFPRVKRLVAEWKSSAQCEIITFGADPDADFTIVSRKVIGMGQRVTVTGPGLGGCTVELPMLGEYNARNALAAIIVSQIIGMELGKTTEYLAAFKSVKRRQEVRAQKNGVVLIEDFAHHPTAVAQTVDAIREAFPAARLWAVFEPRSNTSRRSVFQQEYIRAFKRADCVVLKNVEARAIDQGIQLIDVRSLSNDISASGVTSVCFDTVEQIRQFIWREVPRNLAGGVVRDVVFLMSNGSFDGLNEILERDLMD